MQKITIENYKKVVFEGKMPKALSQSKLLIENAEKNGYTIKDLEGFNPKFVKVYIDLLNIFVNRKPKGQKQDSKEIKEVKEYLAVLKTNLPELDKKDQEEIKILIAQIEEFLK